AGPPAAGRRGEGRHQRVLRHRRLHRAGRRHRRRHGRPAGRDPQDRLQGHALRQLLRDQPGTAPAERPERTPARQFQPAERVLPGSPGKNSPPSLAFGWPCRDDCTPDLASRFQRYLAYVPKVAPPPTGYATLLWLGGYAIDAGDVVYGEKDLY